MALNLMPWNRNRTLAPSATGDDADPFAVLHREMNRMFDDFARGVGGVAPNRFGWSGAWPSIDVSDSEKEITVVAELPGIDEKDVELSLQEGMLTIRGEKKAETDGAVHKERWHGHFERSLSVGPDVDPDKVSATFKQGVLTVTLPKKPDAQRQVKRIQIAAG